MNARKQLHLPSRLADDIVRQAGFCFPEEGCGILVGSPDSEPPLVTQLHDARNISERPRVHYVLDPAAHVRAAREARRDGLSILGFWHSHPHSPAVPSATDLADAFADFSYLIVGEDHSLRSWRLVDGNFLEEDLCLMDG